MVTEAKIEEIKIDLVDELHKICILTCPETGIRILEHETIQSN
jgi:hypothetical protein